MSKENEKEILEELKMANILLQMLNKKIDRLILVSKKGLIKSTIKKEGGNE